MDRLIQKRWTLHFAFAALLTLAAIVAGATRTLPTADAGSPAVIARF